MNNEQKSPLTHPSSLACSPQANLSAIGGRGDDLR